MSFGVGTLYDLSQTRRTNVRAHQETRAIARPRGSRYLRRDQRPMSTGARHGVAPARVAALSEFSSPMAPTIFFHLKFKRKAFFYRKDPLAAKKIKRGPHPSSRFSRRRELCLLALCRSNALLEFGRRHKLEAPRGRSPRLLGWRAHAPARRAHRRPTAIAGVNRRSAARALREATAKRGATVEMPRLEAAATVTRALPVARKGSGPNEAGAGTRDRAVVISETGAVATTAGMGTGAMAGETFEGGSVVQIVRLQSENRSPRARRVARTSLRSSWRR